MGNLDMVTVNTLVAQDNHQLNHWKQKNQRILGYIGDILGFPNYFVVVSTRLVLNTELARDAGAPISVAGKQVNESAVSFRF